MNDAILSVCSAYKKLAFTVPEDFDQQILNYLDEQRRGNRAQPPKGYKTFGHTTEAVWADPTVLEYCQYFGVKPETNRLVDTKTGI